MQCHYSSSYCDIARLNFPVTRFNFPRLHLSLKKLQRTPATDRSFWRFSGRRFFEGVPERQPSRWALPLQGNCAQTLETASALLLFARCHRDWSKTIEKSYSMKDHHSFQWIPGLQNGNPSDVTARRKSLVHVTNFGGLVLGCIEADFANEMNTRLKDLDDIYKFTNFCPVGSQFENHEKSFWQASSGRPLRIQKFS